jgi:N utilization substance protein A
VRLANRLVDWNIDVKTDVQFEEMDIGAESRRAVSELFGDADSYSEEISRISELPGVDVAVAQSLLDNNIDFIEDFLAISDDELARITTISESQLDTLRKLIEEYVEIVEEEEEEKEEYEAPVEEPEAEEEEYQCPECSAVITVDMTSCPNCGIGLSFEYEEE